MRKLIELAVVFLLGWALAIYFIGDKQDNDTSVVKSPDAIVPMPSDAANPLAVTPSNPDPTHSDTTQLGKLQHHLERGELDAFLHDLQRHRDNDGLWRNARAAFFQALQQRKRQQQYREAVQWLTDYLQIEYDDVLALQALAEFHYLMGNYLAAIDSLYQAKSYAYDNNTIRSIVSQQRAISSEFATRLKKENDNLGLLDLYQRLVNAEPEHSEHYVGLAEAYLALGNTADARKTLDIIAYDTGANGKIRQLLSAIESQTSQPINESDAISLTPHGSHLLAQAVFNDSTIGHLLLDTGASLTVITPQMLEALSLSHTRPLRRAWFNTASGVIEAPIYLINRLSIGGRSVQQLEVAVMELGGQNIHGLLGMNFLQHFRFSIDQQRNMLYLSQRG